MRQPQHFVTVDLLIMHQASQCVLLIQRCRPPFAGSWALPGGHVEVDRQETLEQAARRELHEETGLECEENWILQQMGAFGDPGRDPRGAYVAILYAALVTTPEQPVARAGDDAGAVAWFPLHALPELAFDHAHMIQHASQRLATPRWLCCEKLTPTRVRQLTQADYDARQGIIETREGPVPFAIDNYLAQDELGEYLISRAMLEQYYVQIAPPDSSGWASYRSTESREACQLFALFPTDAGVTGQAGDYLIRGSDGRTWPCARANFEQEYRFV
jgi:8-oxo-dGTP diphosphatase